MVNASNPVEVVAGKGTWRWQSVVGGGGGGYAKFFPDPPSETSATNTATSSPSSVSASVNLGTAGQGSANNTINLNNQTNSQSSHFVSKPVDPGPPPAGPDYGRLNRLADKVERQKMIKKAMGEYDALEAATQASGFQAANNAGNVYANRLMQSGINPTASGVVAAQARMPVYKQMAEIGVKREETRLDAVSKADSLAANIASTIANLQLGYANMLADFNQKTAGYELDLNKFNASQALRETEVGNADDIERAKLAAAGIAMSGGGGGTSSSVKNLAGGGNSGQMFPGYIPNSGPVMPAQVNGQMLPGQVIMPGAAAQLGYQLAGRDKLYSQF